MTLRAMALRGGAFLAGRHAMSLAIHLVGVTLLTRAIGPTQYGIYIGAFGVQTYLYAVGQVGLVVFLIRHGGDVGDREFDQAFTLLLIIGFALAAIVYTALPIVEGWIGIATYAQVGRVLALVLPVQLLALVPMGRLERALNYKVIAPAELGGYVAFYVVALALAHAGAGAWAPVAGFCAQQVLVAGALYVMAGYRPHLRWEPPLIREMFRYGVSYSGANWIWQMRELISPVVIGRLLGPAAVAFVSLTVRLVDALSFLKGVGWRVSLSVLGRLQHDPPRMLRAASDAMRLQILALGTVLAGFGIVAPWIIPRIFGPQWSTVTLLYPFVALGYLAHSMFQMETAMLNVIHRTRQVAVFHLVHLVLFASAVAVLAPRIGAVAYGWGEVVAMLGYVVLDQLVRRYVGRPSYAQAALWALAFGAVLFWRQLGWFAVVVPLVAVAWPGMARAVRDDLTSFVRLRHAE